MEKQRQRIKNIEMCKCQRPPNKVGKSHPMPWEQMVVAQVQHSLNLLDHFGRINIVVVYALSTFGVPNTCGCIRGLVGDNGDLIDMQLAFCLNLLLPPIFKPTCSLCFILKMIVVRFNEVPKVVLNHWFNNIIDSLFIIA